MDFWNCRVRIANIRVIYYSSLAHVFAFFLRKNVAGRTLVGLRFWNQVCVFTAHPNNLIYIPIGHLGRRGRRKLLGI